MELGLSLGDSHRFLENKMKNSGIKINGSPDLCMALSLNSWAVEETTQKFSEEEDGIGNHYIYNYLQLNLLPQKEGSSGNSYCRSTEREFENDVVVDDEENGAHNRKKLRLSKQKSAFLEESFKQHNALNPKQKLGLAKQLNLIPRQVQVWFQNRRARTKLKQTEVEWEYLKRSCEKLSEENRKLQKELKELRFLNSTPNPPSYMQLLPPTTLTLCPSCRRSSSHDHQSFSQCLSVDPDSTLFHKLQTNLQLHN